MTMAGNWKTTVANESSTQYVATGASSIAGNGNSVGNIDNKGSGQAVIAGGDATVTVNNVTAPVDEEKEDLKAKSKRINLCFFAVALIAWVIFFLGGVTATALNSNDCSLSAFGLVLFVLASFVLPNCRNIIVYKNDKYKSQKRKSQGVALVSSIFLLIGFITGCTSDAALCMDKTSLVMAAITIIINALICAFFDDFQKYDVENLVKSIF